MSGTADLLARRVAPARAVARATVRSWRNRAWLSAERCAGGVGLGRHPGVLVALVAMIVTVGAVLVNLSVWRFLGAALAPTLAPALEPALGPGVAGVVRAALVQGGAVATAGMTLVLFLLLPARNGIVVAAASLGARRSEVAVGLLAPVLGAAAVLSCVAQAGLGAAALLVAHVPLGTWCSTQALAMLAPVMAGQLATTAGLRARWSSTSAQLLGAAGACLPLGWASIDLLTALPGQPLLASTAAEHPWLVGMAALAVGALVLCCAPAPIVTDARSAVIARLPASAGRVGRTGVGRAGIGVARELLLAARHPVSAAGLCLVGLLVAGLTVGRPHFDPSVVGALTLIVVLLAGLLSETSYGRTAPWHWLYRASPAPTQSWFWPKVGASVVPVLAVVLLLHPDNGPQTIGQLTIGLLAVGVLGAVCGLLAGTFVPYDDNAPGGAWLTSTLAAALVTGMHVAVQRLAESWASDTRLGDSASLVLMLAAVVAVTGAAALAARRA